MNKNKRRLKQIFKNVYSNKNYKTIRNIDNKNNISYLNTINNFKKNYTNNMKNLGLKYNCSRLNIRIQQNNNGFKSKNKIGNFGKNLKNLNIYNHSANSIYNNYIKTKKNITQFVKQSSLQSKSNFIKLKNKSLRLSPRNINCKFLNKCYLISKKKHIYN